MILSLLSRSAGAVRGNCHRYGILLFLLLRVIEELYRRWFDRRKLHWGRWRIRGELEDIDGELVQGCLLSTENLLTLGRVEKRTLFMKSLTDLLGSNDYLVQEVLRSAARCRSMGRNSLVTRWMKGDERYHALQACLNAVSALLGANSVHFNALGGEESGFFTSTWYCLSLVTPTGRVTPVAEPGCESIRHKPRPVLRIIIINETEVRKIADGKLNPPESGCCNSRHMERFHIMEDLARNFQRQLVSTPAPANGKPMSSRNPFTNEKAHREAQPASKPDGGLMKRVHSQPSLSVLGQPGLGMQGGLRRLGNSENQREEEKQKKASSMLALDALDHDLGADEDNCFLRVHVPHFVARETKASATVHLTPKEASSLLTHLEYNPNSALLPREMQASHQRSSSNADMEATLTGRQRAASSTPTSPSAWIEPAGAATSTRHTKTEPVAAMAKNMHKAKKLVSQGSM